LCPTDQDVTILQTGSLQERIAAMQAGAVQGGVAAPPEPLRFRRLGFRSLYDMATSGLQDMPSIAFARAEWLNANQATAQAFTDAIVEGIHFAKTNPDFTKRVLQEYLKLDDPELLDVSYNYFTGANLNRVPDPGREGARRYLTEGPGASDPRAAGVPLDDYFDMRFVEHVQASGFVQQLYGAER
jgi:ABC-type nitrate/sulfonate/bicarbonate transport system substrate-binding protein